MDRIIIGADVNKPLYTFDNATIKECVCVLSSALVGDQIAVDQFMPVVYSASYVQVNFVPAGSTRLITADGKVLVFFQRRFDGQVLFPACSQNRKDLL